MSIAIKSIERLAECISGSFQLCETLNLVFGGRLKDVSVCYSLYGDINKPAIAVLGGISADQYVADTNINGVFVKGWWDALIGYGKAVDLDQFCVVSIDYFDGQSGELNNPNDKALKISTFDQAFILKKLLDELQIKSLACLIGASYGGMVGLAFAQKYPKKLQQLIAIGSTEQSSAKNTAFRSLQRQILAFAIKNDDTRQGLILARSLAMLGYRSEDEIESRFANNICVDQQKADFLIVSYLKAQGEKFADRFVARRFIHLSLSVDLHKIDPTKISTDCLCIGIQDDLIAPIKQVKNLVNKIGNHAKFIELKSNVGHDGFLKEFEQLEHLFKSRLEY